MSRAVPRRWFWLCLALAVLPYVVHLGTPALWDHNEPLYAQPPLEALDGGPLLVPTCNEVRYDPHPPLATWITYPFYLVFGPGELGHRLPMALATLLTLAATFLLGRRLGGEGIGLLALLILAATPKFWLISRQLSGDVYLVMLMTVSMALMAPRLQGESASRRYDLAHILTGVAFLAKGPVVLVLLGGAVLLAWLVSRPRVPFRHLRPVRSVALVLLVGLPWFVGMALAHDDFLGSFFGRYNVDRFFGDLGRRGVGFYPLALLGDAQPWLFFVPVACALGFWRARRDLLARLPFALALWTLVFFTLSGGKRNVYLLPVYPMLALIVAPVLAAAWRGAGPRLARFGAAVFAAGALVTAACLVAFGHHEPRVRPDIHIPTAVAILAGLAMLVLVFRPAPRARVVLGLGAVLTLQLATALCFPALDRFRPVPALADRIRAVEAEAGGPLPVITFAAPVHSLRFYLQRPTRVATTGDDVRGHLGPRTRAFVLVYEHRRARLETAVPELTFTELARGPELRFKFSNTVLGRHRTTRDLILLEAVGAARGAPARPIPRGGCE